MEVGKIIRLVEVYMTNEERARALVEKYGFHFEQITKSEIRELIEEFMKYYINFEVEGFDSW